MPPLNVARTGSGRPLLLVHGLGSSLHNWDLVAPALSAHREVIALDLPGFGASAPLPGAVTIATLTDAVEEFIAGNDLGDVDIVGSSMGARMVMEMTRRGYAGTVVALDPGGFWNDRQAAVFGTTITASVALIRRIQPALPFLTGNPLGRTALLAQFSAHPWSLPQELVLTELRGFASSSSLDEALDSLAHGPRQQGCPRGELKGKLVIGWGRRDKVTTPSQSARAMALFPDATLHWFEGSGHFPHWDRPAQTTQLILDTTATSS